MMELGSIDGLHNFHIILHHEKDLARQAGRGGEHAAEHDAGKHKQKRVHRGEKCLSYLAFHSLSLGLDRSIPHLV